jgi:hypothetical protein
MNKLQYIELIQNKLGGGSVTDDVRAKYRDGIVKRHLGIAFDDMMLRIYQNSVNSSLSDLDSYSKLYTIIAFEPADATDEKYVPVPNTRGKLFQIPNNKAIRKIWTIEAVTTPVTPSRKCIYQEIGMDDVYSQLEVSSYLDNPRYRVMGGNIYLDSNIGTATGVKVWMVVPFDEWDDEEELPAPLENNQALIETVYQSLLNMPPEDKIQDDNLEQE